MKVIDSIDNSYFKIGVLNQCAIPNRVMKHHVLIVNIT